jgi:cbb3-type cytochrome oxidase subunit 3
MYKNVLSSIPGIELYPIVALVLFFGFFTALIVWYFRADKARLERLSRSILQEDGREADTPSQSTTMQRS